MKGSLIFSILIWGVLLFGLYGAGNLSLANYNEPGGICPKLAGIPACYIILSMLLAAAIGHLADSSRLFFIACGLAASIAVVGTVGQLTGISECPKSSGGTPMCYLSLAMFSSLILLKVLMSRSTT